MRTKFSCIPILFLFTILFTSCSKEDSSTTVTGGNSSTSSTNTWVKITTSTTSGTAKSNYIVMMFAKPVSANSPLPPILKQVTTDANGLANFDLNSFITTSSSKTYYFEAFVQNGNGYDLKSITHPMYNIAKGQMITSTIIVN